MNKYTNEEIEASDGAITVVEANMLSYRFARYVKEQLYISNCRILGTILNKLPIDKKGYYGKYYYGKYSGKYYGKYYGRYGED